MKKLWQALVLVRRCDPRSFGLRLLYVVLQSVLPLVNLYLLKLLIDAVERGVAGGEVHYMPYLLGMVSVFLVNRVVSALNGVNNDVLSQRLTDYMSDIMQRQSARLDMAYYDNPDYHDTMHRAQQEASFRPLQIMNNFMALFGALLSIAGIVAMLASASWWVIVVMVVAVMPGFVVRLYKARCIYQFRRDNTQLYRQTGYYGVLLSSRDFAKEMRTFNLTAFFRQRFVDSRRKLVVKLLRISRRMGVLDVLCALIEATAMFMVVWLLVRQAVTAAITMGTFVMLFEAFRRGQGQLSGLVAAVAALYDNRLFVSNLFDFLTLKPEIKSPEQPIPFPERIETVEFRDVTFRYPDMDRDVLSHYSLTARVGEVTLIQGENGYGKSTLVKLLLRLYDPQEGTVAINGIDVKLFALEDLRAHIGTIFQDFGRYNMTAAENIGFTSTEGVDKAAVLAGADSFLGRLSKGYDNMLGRMFDGGAELSMGQWQRVALARMFHTGTPIMLLDEPMAWMDVASREKFMQVLDEVKRDRIVIMITHT